jgi:hypothetical protein
LFLCSVGVKYFIQQIFLSRRRKLFIYSFESLSQLADPVACFLRAGGFQILF